MHSTRKKFNTKSINKSPNINHIILATNVWIKYTYVTNKYMYKKWVKARKQS